MKRLIIASMKYREHPCRVTALWEDGKIQTLHMEQEKQSLLGSIHVGKVQKVLPNISGAFVEIQDKTVCYLPMGKHWNPIYTSDKKKAELKAGDELIVQVTQEALKTKAPCVSCNVSLAGNYLVLTTENRIIGVSGKIPKLRGEFLKSLVEQELPEERRYGVVIRTNSRQASDDQILRELHKLQGELEELFHKAGYLPAHTMIRKGESPVAARLKHMYWDSMEKVITDDPKVYEEAETFVKGLGLESPCMVQLYEDQLLPLYKLYSLEQAIEDGLYEKVWLKSGGFLVIQQTEAFVAIDVNSGKQAAKKSGDDQLLKINLEAAVETARQLRLRNLYGMILVDFINMREKENEAVLLRTMKSLVKSDPVKTTVVDITLLGIMEITRKKEEKSLREQIREISVDENGNM